MLFQKWIDFNQQVLSIFMCHCDDDFCRNFANAFRKWKTIWSFAALVAKFCENYFPKFRKPNKLSIFQFIFRAVPGGIEFRTMRWPSDHRPSDHWPLGTEDVGPKPARLWPLGYRGLQIARLFEHKWQSNISEYNNISSISEIWGEGTKNGLERIWRINGRS